MKRSQDQMLQRSSDDPKKAEDNRHDNTTTTTTTTTTSATTTTEEGYELVCAASALTPTGRVATRIPSTRRPVLIIYDYATPTPSHTHASAALTAPHIKARGPHPAYPPRFAVPDDKVSFSVPFPEYNPVKFTHKVVVAESAKVGGWADVMEARGEVLAQRMSHEGKIILNAEGLPLNPRGRTGMAERGLLGRYGPNHAADPVVTRWCGNKPQVVAIRRADTGLWAIPGGMVDAGEQVSATLRREFEEEAGNVPASEVGSFRKALDELFKSGTLIYKGYVDDPRNTDNAWMETVVMHFHCNASLSERLNGLNAGDDAADVQWLDIDENNANYRNLYASHKHFVDMCRLPPPPSLSPESSVKKITCIDRYCYHMGADLEDAELERLNYEGKEAVCIKCPWHLKPLDVEDGSYYIRSSGNIKCSGVRQQVHKVKLENGNVYVKEVNDDVESRKYNLGNMKDYGTYE